MATAAADGRRHSGRGLQTTPPETGARPRATRPPCWLARHYMPRSRPPRHRLRLTACASQHCAGSGHSNHAGPPRLPPACLGDPQPISGQATPERASHPLPWQGPGTLTSAGAPALKKRLHGGCVRPGTACRQRHPHRLPAVPAVAEGLEQDGAVRVSLSAQQARYGGDVSRQHRSGALPAGITNRVGRLRRAPVAPGALRCNRHLYRRQL